MPYKITMNHHNIINNMNRRTFLNLAAGVAATASIFRFTTSVRAQDHPDMLAASPIALPPLPWPIDSLATTISARTIEFHYGKHHSAYVKKTNELLKDFHVEATQLEDIILQTVNDPTKISLFNNAAQVWNHTFFWHSLRSKNNLEPTNNLRKAIVDMFGSVENCKRKLAELAISRFGSGWVWLSIKDGILACTATANADTPLAHGFAPLLCIDVWEHAYYLDYQNRRADYIHMVLDNILNWDFAAQNFAAATHMI
ncbi:superoxide dismutase, Fe-Mn family [Desulfovibrionales bacterium]